MTTLSSYLKIRPVMIQLNIMGTIRIKSDLRFAALAVLLT